MNTVRVDPPLSGDETATVLGYLDYHRATLREVPLSLRWILLHLLEEYARRNRHAHLLRESIDGTVGE